MNSVKKDDKQRIIAQQKGIKSNIVNRQTKQIIRQSKAKLNNAGDSEESEQMGDNIYGLCVTIIKEDEEPMHL